MSLVDVDTTFHAGIGESGGISRSFGVGLCRSVGDDSSGGWWVAWVLDRGCCRGWRVGLRFGGREVLLMLREDRPI